MVGSHAACARTVLWRHQAANAPQGYTTILMQQFIHTWSRVAKKLVCMQVGMPCHGKGGCNPEIPLVCKEGVCSCREAVHAYDTETNSCVGLVGAQCCTNFDGVDCPYNVTNGCVSGAFCKKTSRTLPGRCACQSYNLESDERTCSPNPTFGQMVTGGKVY